MASTTNTQNLNIEVTAESNFKWIGPNKVEWYGKRYDVKVTLTDGTKTEDISNLRDWEDLATKTVTDVFNRVVVEKKLSAEEISSAKTVFSGSFNNIAKDEIFIIDSKLEQINYVEISTNKGKTEKTTGDILLGNAKTKIINDLSQTILKSAKFDSIKKPNSSSPKKAETTQSSFTQNNTPKTPATNISSPTTPKYTIEDNWLKICEGRNHPLDSTHTTVDFVLADQLMKMPEEGKKYYNKEASGLFSKKAEFNGIAQIAGALRGTASECILKHTAEFQKNSLDDIFDTLKKARAEDKKAFEGAINSYGKLGKYEASKKEPDLVKEVFDAELSKLEEKGKKAVVEIYAQYIKQEGKFIGHTFIKAFVKSQKDLQAIIINQDNSGRKTATSIRENVNEVVLANCAFLHLDLVTNQYTSYTRTGNPELNAPDTKLADKERKRAYIPFRDEKGLSLFDVSAEGSCMTDSISKGIYQSQGENAPSDEQLNEKNVYLRNEAAKIIRNKENEDFYISLMNDIKSIPAFFDPNVKGSSKENYSEAQIASSKNSIAALISNLDFELIQAIIKNNDIKSISQADKAKLKNFYADYVVQLSNNKMNNSLGGLFVSTLPEIPVAPRDKAKFPLGYKIAIVQPNNTLSFSTEKAKPDQGFVFIKYNGTNHYYAVNTKDEDTKRILNI